MALYYLRKIGIWMQVRASFVPKTTLYPDDFCHFLSTLCLPPTVYDSRFCGYKSPEITTSLLITLLHFPRATLVITRLTITHHAVSKLLLPVKYLLYLPYHKSTFYFLNSTMDNQEENQKPMEVPLPENVVEEDTFMEDTEKIAEAKPKENRGET
ncbi:hypothetical protein [Absidia glauca]|uniref:Uncharacterized protein n=1 Tax=Absidia glauca TaxID=4829 RepID=A0A168R8I3_ABSGL|nr:hypothetical protein [Absidia glauca]